MSLTDYSPALPRKITVPVLFTATIFLSATLLFFVQPLFAKLILPKIGGAPAVWTTAMLFFQTVLIAGYVYAHLLIRYLPVRGQIGVHLALWTAALTFLPLSVSAGWQYDPETSTAVQALALLAMGVGVPFAMLSANAPLIQAWYARSGGPSAEDPYFLYGASNLGSLIALLAFPLLAEPFFGAGTIGIAWSLGVVLLGAGLALCGFSLIRTGPEMQTPKPLRATAPLQARDLLTWVFIAFVPSSLMLSITTEISTDLGSFPLIWVVPLALYILSFVITFRQKALPEGPSRMAALLAICLMAVLVSNHTNGSPSWLKALLFAPALFAVAVEAHRMLYARRPEAAHLTVFYITMSVGGALGGLANSIVAPWAFAGVYEGVASVVLAALLMLLGTRTIGVRALSRALVTAALAIALLLGWAGALIIPLPDSVILALAVFVSMLAAIWWRAPLAVFAGVAAFLAIDAAAGQKPHLFKDRSFFGAHAVTEDEDLRVYKNGTTIHGLQRVDETGRPTPLSYYHPEGPLAQILTSDAGRSAQDIGIVGLGVGSLACYALPGQRWAFYEIDVMVDRVARDPNLFTFMSECAGDAPTHLGDARIVLEQQDVTYDILVLDAYSSDAIPVHLVTREALNMYRDRLADDGVMVFHISNRYYDIRQPLARIGAELGLTMAVRSHVPARDDPSSKGNHPSTVVVMSPDAARIADVREDTRWKALVSDSGAVWTDDFANLLSTLK